LLMTSQLIATDFALIVTFRCLECLIITCGKDADAFIDSELLDVVSCTLSSTSRFVRESTFTLLNAIVLTNLSSGRFLIVMSFSSILCTIIFTLTFNLIFSL